MLNTSELWLLMACIVIHMVTLNSEQWAFQRSWSFMCWTVGNKLQLWLILCHVWLLLTKQATFEAFIGIRDDEATSQSALFSKHLQVPNMCSQNALAINSNILPFHFHKWRVWASNLGLLLLWVYLWQNCVSWGIDGAYIEGNRWLRCQSCRNWKTTCQWPQSTSQRVFRLLLSVSYGCCSTVGYELFMTWIPQVLW